MTFPFFWCNYDFPFSHIYSHFPPFHFWFYHLLLLWNWLNQIRMLLVHHPLLQLHLYLASSHVQNISSNVLLLPIIIFIQILHYLYHLQIYSSLSETFPYFFPLQSIKCLQDLWIDFQKYLIKYANVWMQTMIFAKRYWIFALVWLILSW